MHPQQLQNQQATTEREGQRAAKPSPVAQAGRFAFVFTASVFAVCVVVQIFIAGLAVFVTPLHWRSHASFVHIFGLLPILMLILSLVGRLPTGIRWQSFGLFALIYAQYITANAARNMPVVGAAHPVLAMLLCWMAIVVTLKGWRWVRNPEIAGVPK